MFFMSTVDNIAFSLLKVKLEPWILVLSFIVHRVFVDLFPNDCIDQLSCPSTICRIAIATLVAYDYGELSAGSQSESGVGQLLYMGTSRLLDATPAEGYGNGAQAAGMVNAFRISAILGIVMGLYCFTLPRTPPQTGKEKFAFAETLRGSAIITSGDACFSSQYRSA